MEKFAGERYRTRNRVTGTLTVLVDTAAQGLDGDKWTLICDEHGNLLCHSNQSTLRSYLSAPWEWCEDCLTIYTEKGNH